MMLICRHASLKNTELQEKNISAASVIMQYRKAKSIYTQAVYGMVSLIALKRVYHANRYESHTNLAVR